MATAAPIAELAARLANPDPRVRRIAAMDLAAAGEPGLAVLAEHLLIEADPEGAVQIARALGKACFAPALSPLATLRDNPQTPAAVYHAAVLAHDRIERSGAPPGA